MTRPTSRREDVFGTMVLEGPWWGNGSHQANKDRMLEAHPFTESTKHVKSCQCCETLNSQLISKGTHPAARLHCLNLSKEHCQLGTTCPRAQDCGGHFSLKSHTLLPGELVIKTPGAGSPFYLSLLHI